LALAVSTKPGQYTLTKSEREEVAKRARERFELAHDQDHENRRRQDEDTRFVYEDGASWPAKTRAERKAAGDPCMSFPQLRQFVSQVVNEQRQQRPAIHVYAIHDSKESNETAELLQGLIRGIERDSRAEAVYDWGYQHTVLGGRGYWRVVSQYESPDSFNQVLVIQRITDPLSVFMDQNYTDPDGGDREWAFVIERVAREEYKRRWPNASLADFTSESKWCPTQDEVVVADYYERKLVPKKLLMLVNGEVGFEEDLKKQYGDAMPPVQQERVTDVYKVCWYKVGGGGEVLEQYEWPGTIIPIICSMGDEVIIDGKRHFMGLIHQAKDAQTLFDFGMTQQAVKLSLTPRAPFIATKEAVENYDQMWKTANTANWSTLVYNGFRKDGTPIPPPQRTEGALIDSGWLNWSQQMQGLMRSCIGLYENTLGMRGQEVSGRAILAREQQGDNATFHFLDNFSRAIALTGRILLECIPTYYDTQRMVTLVGEDDEAKPTVINQQVPDPMFPARSIRVKDITVGKFAVRVEAGRGYATKRKEMAELTMEMVKAFPPIMQFAGDIVMRVQDIPDADQLAERFKAMLPPQIQQMLAAKDAGQDPQLAAANAQIQQLSQQLMQVQQQFQGLATAHEQLKQDRSASIAASQARMHQAEISAQTAAQDSENDRLNILLQRQVAMEKAANERDKTMATILTKLIEVVAQGHHAQVTQAQQAATAAMVANP
jgi:hypothetical protein